MKKFKIYKESYEYEEIYFQLVKSPVDNAIELIVVDDNGEEIMNGSILSISEEGISVFKSVNGTIGLPLDEFERVKVLKEH